VPKEVEDAIRRPGDLRQLEGGFRGDVEAPAVQAVPPGSGKTEGMCQGEDGDGIGDICDVCPLAQLPQLRRVSDYFQVFGAGKLFVCVALF